MSVLPQSTATWYDLGEDGIIVRLLTEAGAKAPQKLIARTLVVLDVSGSMGQCVPVIVKQVLPEVFRELELPRTEEIQVVAFHSTTSLHTYTVADLPQSTLKASGGTTMAPAVKMVQEILCANPSTPYRLVVISDGQISDKDSCLSLSAQLETQLAAARRNAPTQVCLIRALSSSSADPDTAALTCLGQLNTGGSSAPQDCPLHLQTNTQIDNMKNALLESLKSFGTTTRTLSEKDQKPVLMRLPGAPPLDTLQVPVGESFVLVPPNTDVSQLLVDGEPIEVKQLNLTSEDSILPLLLYLEAQVKQMMVIGKVEARVKQLLDWVGRISHRLFKDETDDKTSDTPSIIERRNKLLREVAQRSRSVVGRLRALANMDAVSKLNSTRQAEFLRGVGTGAQGRALARRAAKVDNANIDDVVRAEVMALRSQVLSNPIKENDSGQHEPTSFYGHDSLPGILNSLVDVQELDLQELGASDILQFVGPLGFTYFAAHQNDCPEPWGSFRLNQIFLGDSTYLNSADLWTSRVQSGDGSKGVLMAPGTQTKITGVVPVRHLSPQAFDVLSQLAPTLLSLQVSASLRGSLVSMPDDLPAMVTAAAVNLSSSLANNPTEAGAVALLSILHDLHHLRKIHKVGVSNELADNLQRSDPRPYLAGDLFISSGLKPLAAILSGRVQPSPQLSRAIFGYSLYLAAGKKYKDPQERKDALNTFLAINAKNDVDPGAPGTPDPLHPTFCRSFDRQLLHKMGDLNSQHDIHTISSVVMASKAFEKGSSTADAFLSAYKDQLDKWKTSDPQIFGTSSQEETWDMAGALALQAMLSPELACRVAVDAADPNIRSYKFPDVYSSADVAQYVGTQVAEIYADRFKRALKVKRDEEEAERCKQLIESLLVSQTVKDFIDLLSATPTTTNNSAEGQTAPATIKDRSSPGYPKLLAALMDSSNNHIPQRLEKISILILGRDEDGRAVWCNGNVLRANYKPLFEFFQSQGSDGVKLWDHLKTIKDRYGGHKYRDSNVPNRHGHSNLFPSWWARGFDSPDSFKAADPDAFKAYLAHLKSKGIRKCWMK